MSTAGRALVEQIARTIEAVDCYHSHVLNGSYARGAGPEAKARATVAVGALVPSVRRLGHEVSALRKLLNILEGAAHPMNVHSLWLDLKPELQELSERPRGEGWPPTGPQPRIQLHDRAVFLDGKKLALDLTENGREAALCFVGHLLRMGGDWISRSEIDLAERQKPNAGLSGQRWDRVRKGLPRALRHFIESGHKGYRLRPFAWHK
jgi:hypothetical protein